MRDLLPFLLLLACPLAMAFMMRGGHGHGAHDERDDRIADLEREVGELRDERRASR